MHNSKTQSTNPSFSSTLLDEIYNSIDSKSQNNQSFVRSINTTKKHSIVTKSVQRDRFFGSVSSSSDSNSSIFSSSDTELTHGKKISSSRPLCFGPSKTKPRKTEDRALFHQNRNIQDCDYGEDWENPRAIRSARSSGNNKQPKTPASPGGRIVNFINSLFNKQSMAVKSYPRKTSLDDSVFVRKLNDYNPSTCSSASSFSRSYLNKNSEKSSDCIKPSARLSPINVRKSAKKNVEDGGRRSVEEIAREFLRDYHKNHETSLVKNNGFEDYEDDDDDDLSDSSSDLFELDLVRNHHNVYGDELPVYETTFAALIM